MEVIAAALVPYFATVIGFLIVWVLTGIRSEMKELKNSVESIRTELGNKHNDLESRVVRLEAGCEYMHRRHDDLKHG